MIRVGDKVVVTSNKSSAFGKIGKIVWKGRRYTSGGYTDQVEVKFGGDLKNRFFSIKNVKHLTDDVVDSSPKSFVVVSVDGVEIETESNLMTKDDAMAEARELQIMNPKCKYGIVKLLATTTPPRQVVDIEDYV